MKLKHFLLGAVCLFSSISSYAQFPYTLSVETVEYQNIDNGQATVAIDQTNPVDYDNSIMIPLGFEMELFGSTTDHIYLEELHYLNTEDIDSEEYTLIVPFGEDLAQNDANAKVLYLTEETSGGKIFKLEWINIGFESDGNVDVSDNFINFQVWFYENTNMIEFHYGPSNIVAANYYNGIGPLIGFEAETSIYTLEGDPLTPSVVSYGIDNAVDSGLTGSIPANTVYRFKTETTVSTKPILSLNDKLDIFPNPVQDIINITTNRTDLQINSSELLDINGKLIRSANAGSSITVNDVNTGVYLLKINTTEGSIYKRIVKK